MRSLNTRCPEIRHPDLCIFLDLTPTESMKRIMSANRDGTEIYETEEILAKVRDTFMKVLDDIKQEDRIAVIDASRDIDTIAADILAAVRSVL